MFRLQSFNWVNNRIQKFVHEFADFNQALNAIQQMVEVESAYIYDHVGQLMFEHRTRKHHRPHHHHPHPYAG